MAKTLWKETLKLWAFTLVNIPLIFWLRPKVLELTEARSVILIPMGRRSRNHLKSMYFAVLCAGADLAPGLLTLNVLGKQTVKCSFLFKDFQADFLKRCEGDACFTCSEGLAISEAVARAVQTRERQNVTLNVTATVPSLSGDEVIARFKLTISIKAKN